MGLPHPQTSQTDQKPTTNQPLLSPPRSTTSADTNRTIHSTATAFNFTTTKARRRTSWMMTRSNETTTQKRSSCSRTCTSIGTTIEHYDHQLIKTSTGASRVFIFDHTVRRAAKGSSQSNPFRSPVKRVHIDQSYAASKNRVTFHRPDEAPELLKGRYQIINVWRPIKTILKDPLAVADARSVPDSDLVPVKLIYPDREGETYAVKPDPGIKWFFRYGQTPDLVTLIKCFDSKTDGRARRVPHSAFVNPSTEDEAGRESIEVRALVFHPEDQD